MRVLLLLGFGFGLWCSRLVAADIDPRVANLVGDDARMITATHHARGERSALRHFFPMGLGSDMAAPGVERSLQVTGDPDRPEAVLTILLGIGIGTPATDVGSAQRLDASTIVLGDAGQLGHAARRWNGREAPGELAARAARMMERFDSWFLVRRPFEMLARRPRFSESGVPLALPVAAREASRAVEEVSGGVRYGAMVEVSIEVLMASAEDAGALATLGRWLPGILQLAELNGAFGRLAELAEDVSVKAEGRSVVLSFRLAEEHMQAIVDRRGER